MPGELLRGVVQVKGASTEQHTNKIVLAVCCNYFREETYTETDDDGESSEHNRTVEHIAILAQLKVSNSFDVAAEQEMEFEIEFQLPANTPLSLGCCDVWIDTDLDIDSVLDKSDKGYLDITPTPHQHAVLSGMNQLGHG